MINDKIKQEYMKNGEGINPFDLTEEQLKKIGHNRIPPMKAIRLKCLDCCCGNAAEVRRCSILDCPLWPFRLGRNRWRSPISDERRGILSENAKKRFSKEP